MADPIGMAGSIVGIVSFGVRLGTALHTYTELASEAADALHDITFDVNATASALRQLNELIEADKLAAAEQSRPPIFKEAGEAEIRDVAAKLEQVYKTIVTLVYKATNSNFNPKAAGAGQPAQGADMVIDPSLLKPLNFLRKAQWPWLAPRIDRCQTQLRWLKISLLINLQIANLAQMYLNTGPRAPGTFDQEMALRGAAEKLRRRQLSLAKVGVKQQGKAGKDRHGSSSNARSRESAQGIAGTGSRDEPVSKTPQTAPPLVDINTTPRHDTASPAVPNSLHTTSPPTEVLSSAFTVVQGISKHISPLVAASVTDNPALAPEEIASEKQTEGRGSETIQKLTEVKADVNNAKNKPGPKLVVALPASDLTGVLVRGEPAAESTPAPASRHGIHRNLPEFLASWTATVFGSSERFLTDTPSDDLEAYIVEAGTPDSPVKLPFGHQRLALGLKQTMEARRGSLWHQYVQMSPTQRGLVDQVAKYARTQSPHVRTCLGIQQYKVGGKRAYYLIFFSLGEPPLPIHFQDCIGRKFKFPFEQCKVWEDMKALIRDCFVFHQPKYIELAVRQGEYDLITAGGEIILPISWGSIIHPGDKITMSLHSSVTPRPAPAIDIPSHQYAPPRGRSSVWVPPQPRIPPIAAEIIDVEPGMVRRKIMRRQALPPESSYASLIMGSSDSGEADNKIPQEEENDLYVVDFAEETKKEEDGRVSNLLSRFTNVTDVASEAFEGISADMTDSDSDSDSGSEMNMESTVLGWMTGNRAGPRARRR